MTRCIALMLLFVPLLTMRAADPAERPEILIADFEGDTYGDWKTTGDAFGTGPAQGTLKGQMHVEGFKGRGLVNTFFNGDRGTGTLTSPSFKIERKYIAFLIGGGKHEKLSLNLLVDGKVVRTATGPNDKPGGAETLAAESWDVGEFAGKSGTIQIIDQATGGWGHINVDHIVQTDRKPAQLQRDVKREILVATKYLNIPIKNGAPKRVVTVLLDGKVIVRNDIELANGTPDWWAFMDVSAYNGKTVTLQVDKLPDDSQALKAIEPSDSIKNEMMLYREPLRGQFHFSPPRGWNNDPNGMVYFNGEYHLFYQHNPYGWGWGNMHWGHAVSPDMVHWKDLGDKLMPDTFGPMFSGSAVVDTHNTSGFGKDGKPPLVLIYTAAGNPTTQCIAYSTDGRTFTKYSGNPVIKQITGGNRDPKVFWHEPTKKWVMVLYVELQKRHTIHFFTSPNLKEWKLASITEGGFDADKYLFECPDFFPLAVDGDKNKTKWVLTAADSQYAVGTFDGTKFTPEKSRLPGNRGQGFYAAQTFSDIPTSDGRRVQIGWFQTNTPGMAFNQSMTIPFELKLVTTEDGPRMTFTPVKELNTLRRKSHSYNSLMLPPGAPNPLATIKADLVEIHAEFVPGAASEVTFTVRGSTVSYDVKKQELIVNNHRVPAPLRDGKQNIRIFCDRTGLEVFASDGFTYVPMPVNAKPDQLGVSVQSRGGNAKFATLEVHEFKSAWK